MELNDLLGAGPKLRAAGGKLCSQLSTQETLRPSSLLAEPEEATLTRAAMSAFASSVSACWRGPELPRHALLSCVWR